MVLIKFVVCNARDYMRLLLASLCLSGCAGFLPPSYTISNMSDNKCPTMWKGDCECEKVSNDTEIVCICKTKFDK
jgi:hypothetical protein